MKRIAHSLAALVVGLALPALAQAQCHTAYRLEYRTVRYPVEVTSYRVECETRTEPRTVVSYKQVAETSERVNRYIVRKAVTNTEERDENVVVCEAQTTMRVQTEDRGAWETQQVCRPGQVVTQHVFVPPACVIDPATGCPTLRPGHVVAMPVQGPAQVETQTFWRPNLVQVQIPETQMVQRVVTRKVPVQVMRYVDEPMEERVPVTTYKVVAVPETTQVSYTVRKLVPVRETRYAERLVCVRVPIDPCTGAPIVVAPAPVASGLTAPALPQQGPKPGPVESQKPVEEQDAGSSVLKKGEKGAAEGEKANGLDKPALEKSEQPADPTETEKKKTEEKAPAKAADQPT